MTAATEEKPKGLYSKLAEVMAEVGRVPKRGRNDFHKYDYVREDDLVEAVRDALSTRGVAMLPSATSVQKEGNLSTVGVTFTFVDGETGEAHTADWFGTGDDKGDKGLYKAYTGAIKYFLMKSFLIPTGDDPEGDTGTDKRAAEKKDKPKVKATTNGNRAPSKTVEKLVDGIVKTKVSWDEQKLMLAAIGVNAPEVKPATLGAAQTLYGTLTAEQAEQALRFVQSDEAP